MPKVSIVMAVFNEEKHVHEAIVSILSQQSIDLELIVVNDGSTDGTRAIVERFVGRDPRVRLLDNSRKGKVSAFNFGVSAALGEWVCIFAGDDIMPPGSLATRYEAVADQSGKGAFVGICRLRIMSEDPKVDGQVIPRNPNKATFSGVCYLMNNAAVNQFWPVPEELPNEDTWLELAAQYLEVPFRLDPVVGCAWRLHTGNSINMMLSFDDFNRRYSIRMAANLLFLKLRGECLSARNREIVEARVACEKARKAGKILEILRSNVDIVTKLRALFLSGPLLYEIRRRLYRLMSGY